MDYYRYNDANQSGQSPAQQQDHFDESRFGQLLEQEIHSMAHTQEGEGLEDEYGHHLSHEMPAQYEQSPFQLVYDMMNSGSATNNVTESPEANDNRLIFVNSVPHFTSVDDESQIEPSHSPTWSLFNENSQTTSTSPLTEFPETPAIITEPTCICSISGNCPRAAMLGLSDCRSGAASAPANKSKRQRTPFDHSTANTVVTKGLNVVQMSSERVLSILESFDHLQVTPSENLDQVYAEMRDCLHDLAFYEIVVNFAPALPALLDERKGLFAISESPEIPFDIRLDARALYIRWQKKDFDTNLLRGIVVAKGKGTSKTIEANYPWKQTQPFKGEGHLHNGAWFPWQITAVRDGAHSDMEAGISGTKEQGAISIVMSTQKYEDRDQGDKIWYCGTRGKNGKQSNKTKLLHISAEKNTPIRVLRSYKLPAKNQYRPAAGLRYDGLYQIVDHELLDQERQLYRFALERIAGQTPIRFEGPGVRPTERECAEWKKLQRHIRNQSGPAM